MPKRKNPLFIYDYWVDKSKNTVYAIVEYKKTKKSKYSNLYLVSSKYHG